MKRFTRFLIAAPGLAIIAAIVLLAVVQGSGGLTAPADGLNSCVEGIPIKRVFPAIPESVAFCWYHQFSIPNRLDVSFWTPILPGKSTQPGYEPGGTWSESPTHAGTWPEFALDVVSWEMTGIYAAFGVASVALLVAFCAVITVLGFVEAWLILAGVAVVAAFASMMVAGAFGVIATALAAGLSAGSAVVLKFIVKRTRIRLKAKEATET